MKGFLLCFPALKRFEFDFKDDGTEIGTLPKAITDGLANSKNSLEELVFKHDHGENDEKEPFGSLVDFTKLERIDCYVESIVGDFDEYSRDDYMYGLEYFEEGDDVTHPHYTVDQYAEFVQKLPECLVYLTLRDCNIVAPELVDYMTDNYTTPNLKNMDLVFRDRSDMESPERYDAHLDNIAKQAGFVLNGFHERDLSFEARRVDGSNERRVMARSRKARL